MGLSRESLITLDLLSRHHKAARAKDEETRAKLFELLELFEWAYPNAAAEVRATYDTPKDGH